MRRAPLLATIATLPLVLAGCDRSDSSSKKSSTSQNTTSSDMQAALQVVPGS